MRQLDVMVRIEIHFEGGSHAFTSHSRPSRDAHTQAHKVIEKLFINKNAVARSLSEPSIVFHPAFEGNGAESRIVEIVIQPHTIIINNHSNKSCTLLPVPRC